MRLHGALEFDLPGNFVTFLNLNGGKGDEGRDLAPGHLRVFTDLAPGWMRITAYNPQFRSGFLVDVLPTDSTKAQAEWLREERVVAAWHKDAEIRAALAANPPSTDDVRVQLSDGTAYAFPPPGAVARIGGGESSQLVWLGLDEEGEWNALGGARVRSSGQNFSAEILPLSEVVKIFESSSITEVRGFGKMAEVVFGVFV